MRMMTMPLLAAGAMLGGCGSAGEAERTQVNAAGEDRRVLRNLTDSDTAREAPSSYVVQGSLIPTPSDKVSRYYLLRERRTPHDTNVAILRQEHGERIAYSRVELDCAKRQFHVLGVARDRRLVEVDTINDGPLRSLEGLPLREEIAAYVCERAGTPLARA